MKNYSADIVVVGGGAGGFSAAVAAARLGAGVVLVEKDNCLGGTATSGLVCELNASSKHGKPMLPAIALELFKRLEGRGAARQYGEIPMSSNPGISCARIRFNPEHLKIAMDEFIVENNVKVLFGCFPKVVTHHGGHVSLVVSNHYQDIGLECKILIDASGNSAAIYLMDESCTVKTRRENLQGVTLLFRLGGIDAEEYLANLEPEELTRVINKGVAEGALPVRILATSLVPGTNELAVNATRCAEVDSEDIEDMSAALLEARRQAARAIPFIRGSLRGCQNAYLTDLAASMGVRDRRKIKGVYELTGEDVISCRDFEDCAAIGAYPIDIHRGGEGFAVQFTQIENKGIYKIPYRSLTLRSYGNVLSGGKCICADDRAFAGLRVMSSVMSIGNAAGRAAAIALKDNADIREIDLEKLRAILREDYPNTPELF